MVGGQSQEAGLITEARLGAGRVEELGLARVRALTTGAEVVVGAVLGALSGGGSGSVSSDGSGGWGGGDYHC